MNLQFSFLFLGRFLALQLRLDINFNGLIRYFNSRPVMSDRGYCLQILGDKMYL